MLRTKNSRYIFNVQKLDLKNIHINLKKIIVSAKLHAIAKKCGCNRQKI